MEEQCSSWTQWGTKMTRTPIRKLRRAMTALALTVTAVMALSACAGAEPKPVESSATPSAPPVSVTIPSTPVGERMQQIVDLLNREDDLVDADLEGLFDSSFTDVVTVADVVQLLNGQIRPAQPIAITDYSGSETQAVATAAGTVGEPFAIQLSITAAGLVDGFALTPVTASDPAQSLDEVKQRLDDLGIDVQYRVARTDADGEHVLLNSDEQAAAPMASIFKLYVLLAVHDEVAAGRLAWDDVLVVTDANRSLPGGQLQDAANGTTVSVGEAAELMISISDNTATDMLIERIGREAVERAVVSAGHHDPAMLTPFLTTREMFALAFVADDDTREQWSRATAGERTAMLSAMTTDLSSIDVATLSADAFWADGVDWFATPADVAAVHEALAARDDAQVTAALTANPGIVIDATAWPQVAYKGGSSVGVLTGSWRAVGADQATISVVVMAADHDAAGVAQAQTELFSLAADIFVLAAE